MPANLRVPFILHAFILLFDAAVANLFTLQNSYVGGQFFDGFEWNTFDDPVSAETQSREFRFEPAS